MVSILPTERSPWEAISNSIGSGLSQTLPQAAQQRSQRETGLSAIDQLQQQLQQSGGDISKMLPAIAKAYSLNPGLERSGLGQFALQNAKANNIYGNGQGGGQGQNNQINPNQPQTASNATNQPRPSSYNIKTPAEMDAKARQDAIITGNPAQYQQSLGEQQTLNKISSDYKNSLKEMAKADNVAEEDLPDFMEVGEQFPTENPEEWLKNTRAAYAPFKKNFDKLKSSFIPGVGSALLGRDRQASLKKIEPTVKDLVDAGREKQVREYLASEYLSPVEIAELVHPVNRRQEANLSKLPNGIFPAEKRKNADWKGLGEKKLNPNPFVPYEVAKEKDPKAMQIMQDRLSDYFKNNVTKDTSLLALANKVWEDKSYHWDQMGPSIRQAVENGLVLEPHQSAEMGEIDSQPPIQSLPDIFKDWWRVLQNFKGAK